MTTGPHFIETMIQEINHLIASGNLAEALATTELAIQTHGAILLYHEKKAEILALAGDRRGAAQTIRKALKLCPDLPYLQRRLDILEPAQASAARTSTRVANRTRTPFCGVFDRYPDQTGRRKAEGGLRLKGVFKSATVEHPLVSIVTAVYNNPRSLERCIRSVIAQDYPNVEYIIIDGGSDEPTLEIIRNFEERIDYYVSEPDRGIYAAMNKGIRVSRGSYICLLNSDDFYAPEFIRRTVAEAIERDSDLVSTDYLLENTPICCRGLDSGTHFGQINLRHNTFLVNRRCYDRVGPYEETFPVCADTVWMHAAFQMAIRSHHIPELLFTFSDGGLSSGSTPARRRLVIDDIVKFYQRDFPTMEYEEAETIAMVRFSPARLPKVLAIANKRKWKYHQNFRHALANYLERCFRDRDNYRLSEQQAKDIFPVFLEACTKLGIPLEAVRIATKSGCFSEIIAHIDSVIALRKTNGPRTILHYVHVFSAPSETFIYDLLCRLENQTGFDNFLLYDIQRLPDTRPFAKGIRLPWADFQPEIREALYRHLFDSLKPDIIIGHFALNTWKLAQRIDPMGIRVPTLSMTHGIDVFSLQTNETYRKFILEHHAPRSDTRFTAVSRYLRDKLVSFGVPPEKIDLVHNSINPRFRDNRRSICPRSPNDAVKMLAIGRLIALKGHRFLIEALSHAKRRTPAKLTLTLVYGDCAEILPELTGQIVRLGLEADVELIPFVDFDTDPAFISRYDLFVHPSTYSSDEMNRAETFGMSVLEAIAAGLPVIVTDAGGVPEVIGQENPFARIVPHANPEALAEAILTAIREPATFEDNKEYADERLARFSGKEQLVSLSQAVFRVTERKIEAALFSTMTVSGAGYAAYRLHRGLLASGTVRPRLHTTDLRHRSERGVRHIPHPTMNARRWWFIQNPSNRWPGSTIFTINHSTILNSRLAEWIKDADIINLHWTARFLSIENISYLTRCGKPVVLTFRDMMPITGGCHSFHGCEQWMADCRDCPQLIDKLDDLAAKTLKAKRRNYDFDNLTLVALSRHSAAILRRAPLFRDCRIEVIPNSIETEVFRPRGKAASRERLGLPQDRRIIAYAPSYSSEVKGYREAVAALSTLMSILPGRSPLVLLIGNETPATINIPLEKHTLGYIDDTEKLSYVYSAADVVIVPSLEETFSNTTAEAIACGTPVVGFKTGAIPELAIDGYTGFTYEVGDVDGLAQGIVNILLNPDMSANCRKHAEEHLRFDLQAQRYERLFADLLAHSPPRRDTSAWVPEVFPEISATIAGLARRALLPPVSQVATRRNDLP